MSCFDKLISIRGLCENDTALYYLDDYDVSLMLASKTADERYVSGKRLIETKIGQAWRSLFKDITFDGMKVNSIIEEFNFRGSENATTENDGVSFRLAEGCDLAMIFVSRIILDVETGGTAVVKINNDGVISNIFSGTLESNSQMIIDLNQFVSDDFRLYIESEDVILLSKKVKRHNGFIQANSEVTNGFNVEMQLRCTTEKYLCKYADLLCPAVVYKALALIWNEVRDTNRLNNLVNLKREDAVTKMAFYDSTFNLLKYDITASVNYAPKGLYQLELEKLNIPTPNCRCCLSCKSDSYIISLP